MLLQAERFAGEVYDLKITSDETKTRRHVSSENFQKPQQLNIYCLDSGAGFPNSSKDVVLCITDPPYVGNVNYAELADFFYVWVRLGLKNRYPYFAPEYSPKSEEIIENRIRGKSTDDFYMPL